MSVQVTAEKARQTAEAAREAEWKLPSFGRELLLGHLRLGLIYPPALAAPGCGGAWRKVLGVITEHAVHALGQQLVPDRWLIQTTGPLTTAQINAARQIAVATGTSIETPSGAMSLSQLRHWATAAGIILALGVLAMTAGLIRSETASELRTMTAAGASATTRRTLAAATAGTLGLLGGLLRHRLPRRHRLGARQPLRHAR